MRFTEISESAVERSSDKQVRLNKLFNERASLKNQLRLSLEEGDDARALKLGSKLVKLTDAIESLQESASPSIALKARLAQLKADYADMPKNPGNQVGYDVLDEIRAKIKKLEDEVSKLTEATADDADATFQHNKMRVRVAMDALADNVEKVARNQRKNVRDWGYAGAMGHVADQLEALATNFG